MACVKVIREVKANLEDYLKQLFLSAGWQKLLNGALVNLLKFWQQMISRLVLGAATSMLATASDGDKFEEKLPT